MSKAQYKDSKYLLDLTEILSKKIKTITGYVSNELGDLAFKICDIVLEDGTKLDVEGEHDFPYIAYDIGDLKKYENTN
jgi:hypothetical protein